VRYQLHPPASKTACSSGITSKFKNVGNWTVTLDYMDGKSMSVYSAYMYIISRSNSGGVVLKCKACSHSGYSGEGEHRFRREAERRSGAKVNSSRSEATLAW